MNTWLAHGRRNGLSARLLPASFAGRIPTQTPHRVPYATIVMSTTYLGAWRPGTCGAGIFSCPVRASCRAGTCGAGIFSCPACGLRLAGTWGAGVFSMRGPGAGFTSGGRELLVAIVLRSFL